MSILTPVAQWTNSNPPEVTVLGSTNPSSGTQTTVTAGSFVAPADGLMIVAGACAVTGGALRTISSFSIGGVSVSPDVATTPATYNPCAIGSRFVNAGTYSVSFSINSSANIRPFVGVFFLSGYRSDTPTDTAQLSPQSGGAPVKTTSSEVNIDVEKGGVILAMHNRYADNDTTWVNATEEYDLHHFNSTGSGAVFQAIAAESSRLLTANFSGGSTECGICAAAWR